MAADDKIEILAGFAHGHADVAPLAACCLRQESDLARHRLGRQRHVAWDDHDFLDLGDFCQRFGNVAVIQGNAAVAAVGIGRQQEHFHTGCAR